MRPALLAGDTLNDCFTSHVRTSPDATATFPGSEERVSARELGESSLRSAFGLMEHGIGPGSVVGLLIPTDANFLNVFFGIQRAGAACSVLPLPAGFGDESGTARRLARFLETAGSRHLVLASSFESIGKLLKELVPDLVLIDPYVAKAGNAAALPAVDPESLSVVQFTSGSTSAPKGVEITQSGMAAGLRACVVSGGFSPDDVFMQWVPTFHDMGLVGLFSHLLNGADVHVFSPTAFLRRPAEVLKYFAEHRGTVLTGPNFSYDQILDSAPSELVRELDLSAWRLAFNGAEPVSAATTERFTRHLAPAGLHDTVMYPVYGMAEATLGITFPRPGTPVRTLGVDRDALASRGLAVPVAADARGAKQLVSVGHPVHGIEVRLVQEGRTCTEGELGEIQIAGPAVTTGYYRNVKATEEAFDGRWFRTGDVGFQQDGHLYVTGRVKDMIIIRGQNYFPEDVEAVVRELPGVYRKRCVAFSDVSPDGREKLCVVVEADPRASVDGDFAANVRARVESEMDLSDVSVHLVKPRWISRTTSGKWQRALTRRRLTELVDAQP